MKTTFFFFFVLLISLLGFSQVKADTIFVQIPGPSLNYCEDVLNYNTFAFPKPLGFGSTVWRINGTIVSTEDTLFFTPISTGNFQVRATWNGNIEQLLLSLYSTPPPSPTFAVLSEGRISDGKDTAWMCGPSITISSNTSTLESVYHQWTGPGEFYSTNLPVTITTPGTYIFERGNPCDTTRDTIEVISLPIVPPVWTDTTFCNLPVSLTLDAGPGWDYVWSTTATTHNIFVDEAGTYSVQLTNVCTSTSASITVYQETYPLPDLIEFESTMCRDSSFVINPSPGHNYSSYEWNYPNGISEENTLTVSALTGNGNYTLMVTQGNCVEYAYTYFQFFEEPITPEICVVTVDPTINKNMVVWTSEAESASADSSVYSPILSYNIYKATSGWQFIGSVPVDQEHVFTDLSSTPPFVSALYKIASVDGCGVESDLSFYHKTILLAVTQGANSGQIPLLWNDYTDESGDFEVDQYYIYRGDSPSTLMLYDSTSGYITSYIDTEVYTQKYYQIVVTRTGGCNPAPVGSKGTRSVITSIFSNVTANVPTGQENILLSNVSLYPNPSAGIFTVKGDNISLVEVKDIRGTVILTTNKTTDIDLSAYASGLYIVTVTTKQGSTNLKLFIE